MKAVRVHTFGGPEVLKVESDVPIPVLTESQVSLFFWKFFPFVLKNYVTVVIIFVTGFI